MFIPSVILYPCPLHMIQIEELDEDEVGYIICCLGKICAGQ
jgi:hypothetical protein